MVRVKRPRHTQYERNGLSPEETLAAVVVKGGLRAWGSRYALSPNGRWWLGIMGLEPHAVRDQAVRERQEKAALMEVS
jgi:hypothetical protein